MINWTVWMMLPYFQEVNVPFPLPVRTRLSFTSIETKFPNFFDYIDGFALSP